MTTYLSILRGINVGGRRKILMADLRKLYEDIGLLNCSTYIQSGNAFFELKKKGNTLKLATKIEKAIAKQYGFDVPVIVMTIDELENAIGTNPFFEEDTAIERLHLTFLKELPTPNQLDNINEYNYEPDQFKILGKNAFIFCSKKYSDTKLTNKFFETKLKVTATTRNWKTVLKLSALAENK